MEEKKQLILLCVVLILIFVIVIVINIINNTTTTEITNETIDMSEVFIDGVSQDGLDKIKNSLSDETYQKYKAIFTAIEAGEIEYDEDKHLSDYEIPGE